MSELPEPRAAEGQLCLGNLQRTLYEALARKDQRLGDMYLGALQVRASNNRVAVSLAAHSLRELMDKAPKYLSIPVPTKPVGLKAKVTELLRPWDNAKKRSQCCSVPDWAGDIDGPLQKFLRAAEEFFQWFASERPVRRERTARLLRGLDPTRRPLPGPIEDLRVKEWDACHDYFAGVAHHETPDEYDDWVAALEQLLIDKLYPRTFADLASIDSIIEEAERSDNA